MPSTPEKAPASALDLDFFVEDEDPFSDNVNELREAPREGEATPTDKTSQRLSVQSLTGIAKSGIDFITRNGNLTHKTPVPPPSDVAELEYVSALHQCSSMQALRQDCSISADEIAHYLKSRHGLCVTPEIVRTAILQDGLTADRDESHSHEETTGGVMDLVELTSALIIPNLMRLRRKRMDDLRLGEAAGKVQSMLASMTLTRKTSLVDLHMGDDYTILQDALLLMLEDCTGDSSPKEINEDLVRDILCGYGEGELAEDDDLVSEMVRVALDNSPTAVASAAGGTLGGKLDIDTFVAALTSDVARKYDHARDKRRSTNFEDAWLVHGVDDSSAQGGGVGSSSRSLPSMRSSEEPNIAQLHMETAAEAFGCKRRKGGQGREVDDPQDKEGGRSDDDNDTGMVIKRLYTGQGIDYTVDTYRTRVLLVALWVAFVLFYLAYFYIGTSDFNSDKCQAKQETETLDATQQILCPLIRGIVNQLLLITKLVIFGTPFIVLGSVGNDIEGRCQRKRMFAGIVLFAAYIYTFYFASFSVDFWIHAEPGDQISKIAQLCSVVTGSFVILLKLINFVMLSRKKTKKDWRISQSRYFKWGNVNYEAKIKRSALFKVDQMLSNAHDVHREVMRVKKSRRASNSNSDDDAGFLSNFGMALTEYSKRDGLSTYIGGIAWTWKRIYNGTLFTEEGIWISGRFVVGSVFQVVVVIAVPIVAFYAIPLVEKQLDPEQEIDDFRSNLTMGFGVTCAFFTSVLLTILFIPTVVATTMKFRRGVLQSLRSEDFLFRYRFALDQSTLALPGMFWGCLLSSLAIGLLAGGFIYVLLWPQTQSFIFGLIGNLLGLCVILIVKIVAMQVIRFTHYKAFYRTKPLSANIINVCLECYAIGISLYFMVVRAIKIIIIAALYLGRIDTTLFSPGVGIFGPLELDNWPTVTRKEILIHEAHRHPYIETLGYLYMMQLKYRDRGFAARACSAWRLVFTLAFMPWLHKYRDSTRPEHFGKQEGGGGHRHVSIIAQSTTAGRASILKPSFHANRLMKESMIAPRWLPGGLSALDEEEEAETAEQREITRLQAELEQSEREISRLRAKLKSFGQETGGGSSSRPFI